MQIGGTEKMSKSKNNGIDPQAQIDQYGADTARLFTMFASPPEQTLEWSDTGVEGANRFLRRVWAFAHAQAPRIARRRWPLDASALTDAHKTLRREVHKVLQQADYDYRAHPVQHGGVGVHEDAQHAGSRASWTTRRPADAVLAEGLSIFLRVLYPVAPHITHVLWQQLGYAAALGDILDAPWPQVDAAALEQAEIELMIQVNGKLRGSITRAQGCRQGGHRGGGAGQRRRAEVHRPARRRRSSWCRASWSTSWPDPGKPWKTA